MGNRNRQSRAPEDAAPPDEPVVLHEPAAAGTTEHQAGDCAGASLPLQRTDQRVARHIECHLSPDQAQNLRDLFDALVAEGTRLADHNRLITRPVHALMWLLEQIPSIAFKDAKAQTQIEGAAAPGGAAAAA